MRHMTVSESRAQFASTLDSIVQDRDEVLITREGGNVVLIAEDEYNSIIETAYLLSSPANAEHLRRGIADIEGGRAKAHRLDD